MHKTTKDRISFITSVTFILFGVRQAKILKLAISCVVFAYKFKDMSQMQYEHIAF